MRKYLWIMSVIFTVLFFYETDAAYTIKKGRLVDADSVATLPAEEHYGMGCAALDHQDFKEAARQLNIVVANYPDCSVYEDAAFYLGVAYYHLEDFDFANDAFSNCLHVSGHPKYFQEALEYKYYIAEQFRNGAKRHFFGTKKLPKWASATDLAIQIYDEVITTLPCHDLAAQALYSKGCMLWMQKDYRNSILAFEMILKRFPKHELAPESYRNITKIYLTQSESEFQNPDLIALAEINNKKFEKEFPKEERLNDSERDLQHLKERYAKGLYDTGQFYEKTRHLQASIIYYRKAMKEYPDTEVARLCRKRLDKLCPTEKRS